MDITRRFAKVHVLSCLIVGLISPATADEPKGPRTSYYAESEVAASTPVDTSTDGLAPCCDPCCDECGGDRLFGLFLSTADTTELGCFISPLTNPVYFEDPRTLTEARAIFMQHKIPNRAPLAGGDAQVIAVQLRAALTENLSIIATKDGYISLSEQVPAEDGWADVNLGLKYNLYKDYDLQRIVSAAVVFEMPVGSTRTLQGHGSGIFDLKLTGAAQLSDRWRGISALGIRLPSDTVDNSTSSYLSVHFDRTLGNRGFYFVNEYNWYHWLKSGQNGIPGVEGLDLFNFGSTGVAGNDIVTGAIGLAYKPTPWREYSVAWEVPLTDRRDIIDNRITVNAIFRY